MKDADLSHYQSDYFAWHRKIGEFGAWAHAPRFQPHLSGEDVVLDFGCGGADLLSRLKCAKRLGVDINPAAREFARTKGVEVYASTTELPRNAVDVIISNNALEHTRHPLQELKDLRELLRPGGKAVFVVPCETRHKKYHAGDINQHLYSWSPMCIGNLFTEAGYLVESVKTIRAKWPPGYRLLAKYGGRRLFQLAAEIYGRLERSYDHVELVARRPESAKAAI